ncbi:MAG: hypothetical protein GXP53_13820 [Deltaproteobacteria bacterium]|nr:hypothetical protein [Deltaproteobacteria bacterium]
MSFFDIFRGKSPEEHEFKGDEFLKKSAFGDAKIEFEKAIDKITRRYPEKIHFLDRIETKHRDAAEALARGHVGTGDEMAQLGDHEEARTFYRLALELTTDGSFSTMVEKKIASLSSGGQEAETECLTESPMDLDSGNEETRTGFVEADKDEGGEVESAAQPLVLSEPVDMTPQSENEIFSILLHALPEAVQKAYAGYGDAFKKGYIALNQADFAAAVRELTMAHEENAGSTTFIPLELATAYIHLPDFNNALALLDEYVAQSPYDIRVYQLFCELFWEAGTPKIAMARLSTAPESIRSAKPMQLLAGETLFQIGAYDAAENVFNQGIRMHGKDEHLTRGLAKTYEARGEIVKARESYAWILNHCAGCGCAVDPIVKRRYADLCFKSNDRSARLLEVYFSLVTDDPDNRKATFEKIAQIYEENGNNSEARRYRALAGKSAAHG